GIELDVSLAAPDTLALFGLVAAGLGITIYPGSSVAIYGAELLVRPITDSPLEVETVLVWKRSNRSKAVARYIEIVRELSRDGTTPAGLSRHSTKRDSPSQF